MGQGLGRRPRLDEARRLRHALPGQARRPEGALSRRRRTRTRWSGYLPHCTFNLNPRAASIDTPLHAFLPYTHVDHMHPDAVIAIAASKNSRALTQGDLRRRDRLAAVAAAGLRARPDGWRSSPREPEGRAAWCSKATASSPGATTREGLLRDDDRHHQPARSTGSTSETARQAGLRRRGASAAAGRRAPRAIAARADAGDPRPDLGRTSARSAISTTSRRCWNSSTRSDLRAAGRARHLLPRPFPAHQDPAAGASTSIPPSRDLDATLAGLAGGDRGLPRRLRRLLRALQARRQPGDARPERRWSIWCPASA